MCYGSPKQKKTGEAVLMSDKGDFRINNITGKKDYHFIAIRGQFIRKT